MNEYDEKLRELLRSAMPPVDSREPERDLWPRMLARLERRPARIPWWDFALAGAALAGLVVFPEMIPWVLWQC